MTLLAARLDALHGQIAIGARVGQGEGSANYGLGQLHARVHVIGPLHASAIYEQLGGGWACAASLTGQIGCGYDGYSISVGPTAALLTHDRFFLALTGAAGVFVRNGSYGGDAYVGDRNLTASLGLDGEVEIVGPFHLQIGVIHRRIFDDVHENALGEYPHVTAVMAGISFVFE